jgi:hypothetical protein
MKDDDDDDDDLFSHRPSRPDFFPSGIPHDVCELFEQLALQIRGQGFARYSARAILHRIRWHYHIERGMREFKCNNNWTPTMARWCLNRNPQLEGFFELRSSPHAADEEEDEE